MVKLLKALFILIMVQSCSKFSADNQASLQLDYCVEGVSTTATPCLVSKDKYIYSSEYNGRITSGTNKVTNNGVLSVTIPQGWYDGAVVTAIDTDLVAANIKAGVSVLGVLGQLTAISFPMCNTGSYTDASGRVLNSCEAESSSYVYDTSYGGRGLLCVEDQTLSTKCWINASGRYILTNTATVTACTVEGVISSDCIVSTTNYWYTTAFGGRSTACTIEAVNGSACWTNQSNIYIRAGSPCADNSYNGGACNTAVSRYVYTTEYGGRSTLCTSNNVGSCWFNASKSAVDTNLVASNVRSGATIFGIAGTATGVITKWGSGLSRYKSTSSTVENYLSYEAETGIYNAVSGTALPADTNPIPKISVSHDGYSLNGVTPEVTKVNRATWSSTTCGVSQTTLNNKISDCSTVFGSEATWNGRAKGHNGEGIWKLVTRTANLTSGKGREVWQDQSTGLMWSSLISVGTNWCKATGSSNSTNSDIIAGNYNEDDPSNFCDNAFYQDQTSPISACEDALGFSVDSDIDIAGKSNLNKSSAPNVKWRTPTLNDYTIANHNGIRFVMPDMHTANIAGAEWTATVDSTDRSKAWLFDPTKGTRLKDFRNYSYAVRCIGR